MNAFKPAPLILAALLTLGAGVTHAADKAAAAREAQKIIDGCWKLSEELRSSPSVGKQRQGAGETFSCLKAAVLEQMVVLFPSDLYTREKALARLNRIRDSYGRLYWDLYNEHKGCFCGTIFQVLHMSELATLFEKILRDMIATRRKYGIGK